MGRRGDNYTTRRPRKSRVESLVQPSLSVSCSPCLVSGHTPPLRGDAPGRWFGGRHRRTTVGSTSWLVFGRRLMSRPPQCYSRFASSRHRHHPRPRRSCKQLVCGVFWSGLSPEGVALHPICPTLASLLGNSLSRFRYFSNFRGRIRTPFFPRELSLDPMADLSHAVLGECVPWWRRGRG